MNNHTTTSESTLSRTISDVEIIPVAHREPPLRNSWGAHSELAARTILRITTTDGEQGIAETYGDEKVIDALDRAKTHLQGMNPYNREQLRLQLQDPTAYGAVETALFDLIGKEVGEPVCNLLGGKLREEVEYSGYLFYKYPDTNPEGAAIAPQAIKSPEDIADEAEEFIKKHGFNTLKLKAGVFDPQQELKALELISERFGSDTPLRIDPNGNWSVETAISIANELESSDLSVQFLEDPVPTMNAHARLKKNITIPIATNMFVVKFNQIAPAVQLDAVDIILSDHHYWGGLSGNMKLNHISKTFDLGVGMHSNSHLGVSMMAMTHVAAAMSHVRYACDTHYPWIAEDVIRGGHIEFDDGKISVPTSPGLGVELDDDRLGRMNDRYHETDPLAYSDVSSMAAEYADSESEIGESQQLPNKPRW